MSGELVRYEPGELETTDASPAELEQQADELEAMAAELRLRARIGDPARRGRVDFVMVGFRAAGNCCILASDKLVSGEMRREARGFQSVPLGSGKIARLPVMEQVVTVGMEAFHSVAGATYQEALASLIGQWQPREPDQNDDRALPPGVG